MSVAAVRLKKNMKILILGAGQVGSTAAQNLSREEANEITAIIVYLIKNAKRRL